MHQITSFKILFYTVLRVLFSYIHGFGPKKYLSTSDFRKKHINSNIFASSKYGNFLQHALRLRIHLVCIHNLPDLIWRSFEWKQDIQRLFSATRIVSHTKLRGKIFSFSAICDLCPYIVRCTCLFLHSFKLGWLIVPNLPSFIESLPVKPNIKYP